MKKKIGTLMLCLVMVAGLIACSPKTDAKQTKEESKKIELTDAAGRKIELEKPAEKIVSGYYIPTSMLLALDLGDKLVGRETKDIPIYNMVKPDISNLPTVGTAKDFDLEGCIKLKPDLVILPKKLADAAETLTETGIPSIVINPETKDGLLDTIGLLGKATGAEKAAKKYTDYYNDKMKELSDAAKTSSKPKVYIAGTDSILSAASPAMYQNTLIETAGGVNAASDLTDAGWANVSYEQVINYNPDIIVVIADAQFSVDDVKNDPQLQSVKAIQDGAVYQMPKDYEAWDSPVPATVLGSLWLADKIVPENYSTADFQADAKDFYKQFYNLDIDTDGLQ